MNHLFIGIAAAVSAPAVAQSPATAPAPAVAPADPARLAAAERAVAALVPKGIYMKMMREKMPQMIDAMMGKMMSTKPGDLGLPARSGAEDSTMGAAAQAADPAFEERVRITTRVMFEEMGTVFDAMEPRVRAGLARAFARKFTLAQLDDFNAFFATPSGSAFAGEYLLTFMDPELMQEMMGLMPEILKAMPGIETKVEKATAHLPPEPKPARDDDALERRKSRS